MGVWYTTREEVKSALESAETARNNVQVDRAIEASSRALEGPGLLNRRFYPELATRSFDWPDVSGSLSWQLWLGQHELISATSITSGGVALAAGTYLLEPVNTGPPYDRIEIDLSQGSAFSSGSTFQRAIAVLGLWGHRNDTEPAGALAAAISSTTATTITVTDGSMPTGVGVGHLITIDSERLIVTGKSMADSGQTLGGSGLTASTAGVSVAVTTGSAYAVDEVILIDSERMRIVDIAGNTLTVKRAWDGTVLAAHSVGATIYAARTLTVTRGVLGTTAATHTNSTAITRHAAPGPVRTLCLAESMNTLLQEGAGYARVIGSGESARTAGIGALKSLRQQVIDTYGRGLRTRAV